MTTTLPCSDGGGRIDDPDLLEHSELVEIVPAFDRFAVLHTNKHHPVETDLLAGRREAQAVAAMGARSAPSRRNNVALGHDVVDLGLEIGKRIAIRGVKWLEPCRSVQILAETVHDCLTRKYF